MREVAVSPARGSCPRPAGRLLAALLWGASAWPSLGAQDPSIPTPLFSEVASQAGLDFKHFNGAGGNFYLPEIVGSGAALLDYDGDGDLDVYLVQGTMLEPGERPSQSWFAPDPGWRPGHRLYRNELIPGGSLKFREVTTETGLDSVSYGMGAAVGDYDNDGDLDLYLTNYGPNLLYRNNGDATFTPMEGMGADDSRWTTSAAFLDYDRDGDLDLFLTNYVGFTVTGNQVCRTAGARDYCLPTVYSPLARPVLSQRGRAPICRRDGAGGAGGRVREWIRRRLRGFQRGRVAGYLRRQ